MTHLVYNYCFDKNEFLPVEHLEALISEPLDVTQMLNSSILFALRLAGIYVEEVAEVADAVVTVLVKGPKQFFQTFLDAVGVGWILVQSVCVACHGVALLLVNGGQDALLMYS